MLVSFALMIAMYLSPILFARQQDDEQRPQSFLDSRNDEHVLLQTFAPRHTLRAVEMSLNHHASCSGLRVWDYCKRAMVAPGARVISGVSESRITPHPDQGLRGWN